MPLFSHSRFVCVAFELNKQNNNNKKAEYVTDSEL